MSSRTYHRRREQTSRGKVSQGTKKRSSVGATKRRQLRLNFAKIRQFSMPLVGGLLVLALLMKVDFKWYLGKFEQLASRPITSVIIRGEFKFTDKVQVQQLIRKNLNGDFVNLDLSGLKKSLETNPWIESVELIRVWPAKLVINVREQMPIARWGEHGFLNRYGNKISVEDNVVLNHLPRLLGPEAMEKEIAREYLSMSRLLAEKNISLQGVSVDESMSWVLNLQDDKLFYLGVDNLAEKLNLFLQIYDRHLASSLENIKKIDMRYESGLAVQWVDGESQDSATNQLRASN